jgi:hypothetical protein
MAKRRPVNLTIDSDVWANYTRLRKSAPALVPTASALMNLWLANMVEQMEPVVAEYERGGVQAAVDRMGRSTMGQLSMFLNAMAAEPVMRTDSGVEEHPSTVA